MGVPPAKVADVMALMGDSIDNIPGARDPNDKTRARRTPKSRHRRSGRAAINPTIRQRGRSSKRASEVKRSSYREALEKCGEFVRLSKQLATIPTDAPVPLICSTR